MSLYKFNQYRYLDKNHFKLVRRMLPAHDRYYQFAGYAVGQTENEWLVQICGVIPMEDGLGLVLSRRKGKE